jgi:hypothetical protein
MDPKRFKIILFALIAWLLVLFVLQIPFGEQTKEFGLSCGACFLSIFCLFGYKNALKPTETVGAINSTKRHYERNGNLPGYQRFCKIMFLVLLSVSAIGFLKGLAEAAIFFIRQAAGL